MGSRDIKDVISFLHKKSKKSKSLERLKYSPTFVDCNSEVRLRLGLKGATKWPIRSKVGRDLTRLNVRSKSVDCYKKTTEKRQFPAENDIEEVNTRVRKRFRSRDATRKWFWASLALVACGLATFATLVSFCGDSYNTDMRTRSNCNCTWTIDVEKLGSELRNEVYGQDVAIDVLLNALRLHPCDVQLRYARPLILFLHGWSGSGKTLVARILADSYVRSGANVHWYIPTVSEETKDFAKWVERRSSDCGYDVYILDDFDSIVSQFDFVSEYLNGTSHERNVFVVTSNKGEKFLADQLLKVLMRNGSRNEIMVENLVSNDSRVYLPYSTLSNVTYVPFLPIEREQLRICVSKAMKRLSSFVSIGTLNTILNRTKFVPESFPVFSKTGCKKLHLV